MTRAEKKAREYAHKTAQPILRDMLHMSRWELSVKLEDAFSAGYRAALEEAADAAEQVGLKVTTEVGPGYAAAAFEAASSIRAIATSEEREGGKG